MVEQITQWETAAIEALMSIPNRPFDFIDEAAELMLGNMVRFENVQIDEVFYDRCFDDFYIKKSATTCNYYISGLPSETCFEPHEWVEIDVVPLPYTQGEGRVL